MFPAKRHLDHPPVRTAFSPVLSAKQGKREGRSSWVPLTSAVFGVIGKSLDHVITHFNLETAFGLIVIIAAL